MKIFGPKRDDVTEEWGRLYKEEIYDLCSPNIIQWSNKKEWVSRACSTCVGEVQKDLVVIPEG